jgi:hypothetical protein
VSRASFISVTYYNISRLQGYGISLGLTRSQNCPFLEREEVLIMPAIEKDIKMVGQKECKSVKN